MKEYGGYIEFETFHGKMLHENAVALNCGRNALAYLCKAKKLKKCICHISFVHQFQICVRKLGERVRGIQSMSILNRFLIKS